MSLKRDQNGFTLIELLIVCIVIVLLVALVATTFASMRQKTRDKQRSSDIKMISLALESYYGQNVKYPTLNNLNDPNWRTKNLKGLDSDSLKDPKGIEAKVVATPVANAYSYEVTPIGCTNLDNNDCTNYTLTATLEGGGNFVRSNIN